MIEINQSLLKDIEEYCKVNNIDDINKEINKILRKGFNLIKYGSSPFERRDIENGTIIEKVIIEEEEVKEKKSKKTKKEEKTEINQEEEKTQIIEEPKPKRKYTRKVRIIKNE